MSTDRFTRPPPSMRFTQAVRLWLAFKRLAEQLDEAKMHEEAAEMARRAQWWSTYADGLED